MMAEKIKRVSIDVALTNHKQVLREAVDTNVRAKQYYEQVITDHFKNLKSIKKATHAKRKATT